MMLLDVNKSQLVAKVNEECSLDIHYDKYSVIYGERVLLFAGHAATYIH